MHRRSFITGLISLMAAPAIVRVGSLMPIKQMLIVPSRSIDELFSFDPISLSDFDLLKIVEHYRKQRELYIRERIL